MTRMNQILAVVLMTVMSSSVWAFGLERFVEGVHYKKVEGAAAKPNTVIEFFSFGCPHCKDLEPQVHQWLGSKPKSVEFSRVPATWNSRFATLGKLYYVIEALGIEETAVPAVFEYLHDQGKNITGRQEAWALLSTLGVSEADFDKAWKDPKVETLSNTAGKVFGQYQIRGVPAFVVNGQYETSVRMAGSKEEVFEVVNFLLSK